VGREVETGAICKAMGRNTLKSAISMGREEVYEDGVEEEQKGGEENCTKMGAANLSKNFVFTYQTT
jgi:hypothetical protein